MGSQIAAHLANAGVPVLLLDVSPEAARDGLEKARKLKPDPFFTPDTHGLITTDGFDAGMGRLASSDWIIEAIVERLDLKRQLLARIEACRRPDAIVSTNTSGIPVSAIAEGMSDGFRKRFLGTHFFNPPRYLRLLELIPTPDTDPEVVDTIATFADRRLGKGVVIAKDTPNFIANHIGLYGVARVFEALEAGFTIEEIDAITGPALGRPKSATFRTMDIAGIDVLGHVAKNLAGAPQSEALPDPSAFRLPTLVEQLVAGGQIGDKAGRGFYKRVKQADGSSEIHTLDPATLEYRPKQSARLPALDAAKNIADPAERIRALYHGKDRVGDFLRRTLRPTLEYVAHVAPHIARSEEDIDRAMRWGFGWELGPFETMRALGLRPADSSVQPASFDAPGALKETRIIKKNAGATLRDLGDGVLCVEFHSKMNAIGGDTIEMLHAGVKEASKNFAALVVGNDAPEFFRRCEPHAPSARSAGRQLGRDRSDGAGVSEGHDGAQARRRPRRRVPGRLDARWRLRDSAARRSRPGGGRELHRPRGGRRRADPGRRWNEGNAAHGRPPRTTRFRASSKPSASQKSRRADLMRNAMDICVTRTASR